VTLLYNYFAEPWNEVPHEVYTKEEEKDVGTYINPSLKPGEHCCPQTAYKMLQLPRQKRLHKTV
jgi:hypothetical protein